MIMARRHVVRPSRMQPREAHVLTIRIFQKGDESGLVKVCLIDGDGTALRELQDPIGHVPGAIDWEKTAATCRAIAGQGIEVDLVMNRRNGRKHIV